jgi:SAM-dependent methyltransferase
VLSQHPLDEQTAVQFYENRYEHGYMEEWPVEKKLRISEIVRDLPLPSQGEALDFGCGNGVLTDVLRCALPSGWKVFGSDISRVAIENARSRFPACAFSTAGDSSLSETRFDLIFTHHTLEHVIDLKATLAAMDGLLKQRSAMFHILPCGNPGSLEHRLATLRRDGINADLENRFFYEDEGHVRRLTTDQLADPLNALGFHLVMEYYSGQHYRAIEWITDYGAEFVRLVTDPSQAIDSQAALELDKLGRQLARLHWVRERARQYRYRLALPKKTWKNIAYLVLGAPVFAVASASDRTCRRRSSQEWTERKGDRNGSEMYLFFQRSDGAET